MEQHQIPKARKGFFFGKTTPYELEKIFELFSYTTSDEGLIFKIYKAFTKSTTKTNHLIKNKQKR